MSKRNLFPLKNATDSYNTVQTCTLPFRKIISTKSCIGFLKHHYHTRTHPFRKSFQQNDSRFLKYWYAHKFASPEDVFLNYKPWKHQLILMFCPSSFLQSTVSIRTHRKLTALKGGQKKTQTIVKREHLCDTRGVYVVKKGEIADYIFRIIQPRH